MVVYRRVWINPTQRVHHNEREKMKILQEMVAKMSGLYRSDDATEVHGDSSASWLCLALSPELIILDYRKVAVVGHQIGDLSDASAAPALVCVEKHGGTTLVHLYTPTVSDDPPTTLLSRFEGVEAIEGNAIWHWQSENCRTAILLTDRDHLVEVQTVEGVVILGPEAYLVRGNLGVEQPVAV